MTNPPTDPYDLTEEHIEQLLGGPFEKVAHHNCHAVSLAIVKAGWYDGARVARGWCDTITSQHSWVVIGDPYDPDAPIIDCTWWSYNPLIEHIYIGCGSEGWHHPHGEGSIWDWGQPVRGDGPDIELTPAFELSHVAQTFLQILGPLDRQGWATLSAAPVQDWPAGEIFAAMDDTPELKNLVPIDKLGMTTDRNPNGLYLP